MNDVEEIAKAVQEASKLGGKSLGTAEKVGGFFVKVFKEPTLEVVGIITDKLRFMRWKRTVVMVDEVNGILSARGVTTTRPVPPKLALPILEESSLEEDETLQELWTNLLANAMDPNFETSIRTAYVGIIKELEPIDAKILKTVYSTYKIITFPDRIKKSFSVSQMNLLMGVPKKNLLEDLEISEEIYEDSMNNLFRVNCLEPFFDPHIDLLPEHSKQWDSDGKVKLVKNLHKYTKLPIPLYCGTSRVALTLLGKNFIEACLLTD